VRWRGASLSRFDSVPARLLIATASAWVLCGAKTPEQAVVTAGNARFEFLTPSLVRMEYAPDGTFVDAPTAVVLKRDWPVVAITSREEEGWLSASSSVLTVRYKLSSGGFTATNLAVSWKDRAGATHEWHPGDLDAQNLGGLTYSLDNISEQNLPADDLQGPVGDSIPGIDLVLPTAQPGLLSRSGYAFIDDSQTPVWNAARTWIEPRRTRNAQDSYLFSYDRNYSQVLAEYAQLCGPVPMIPRFVLGPWITDFNFEYFPGSLQSRQPAFQRYNQQYLLGEVARLRRSHIPFDVLVLDFAWHNYGWDGGYDFSPLFPRPQQLMRSLHGQGVKSSLNDHPGYINTAESILSFQDSHAAEVLSALARPPPPQAGFDLDLSRQWSFASDSHGPWRPIRIGLPWQEQGFKSDHGIGWYRASVSLPAQLPAALYLYLGQVERAYRIFVNGKEAMPGQIHWPQRLTFTDITPYVVPGRQNEILLRVESAESSAERPAVGGIMLGPAAIRDVKPPERITFDLADEKQAEIFMRSLHGALMQQGVNVWWVDGGSGAADMPGLNQQLWTNKVFYDYSQRQSSERAFILGRYGGWGSERYPGFFTGDAYSQWPVLAYEVAFAARGGNVLVPYISHDIGGFHGAHIDFDLYGRWIEFGTFSAILRMHSAHENPREGNVRMPWFYGTKGMALMRKYFTLRTQLIPYLYTYAWVAHTRSLPLLRPLYLEQPDLPEAYRHSREYFLGEALLVAPVLSPSGEQAIYLPPGQWLDFFSGKRFAGDRTFTAHYAADEIPVFVRDGAVIPEQPSSDYSDESPLERLILNVYGSGSGSFELYEDDGVSLGYQRGEQAHTTLEHTVNGQGAHALVISPTEGSYAGQPAERAYELRIYGGRRPSKVTVNGREIAPSRWEAARQVAVVEVAKRPIPTELRIGWQ
jgi:alpha-glucosidase (family GH31 glycosyl hydrolase)